MAFVDPVADDSQCPVGEFVNQFADTFSQRIFNPALDPHDVQDTGIEAHVFNRVMFHACRHLNSSRGDFNHRL